MARLGKNGQVISSGQGVPGLHAAWNGLNAWLKFDVPDNRKRMILVRKGDPGDGGQGHGQAWQDGWADAKHNALHRVRVALGLPTSGDLRDVPAVGTHRRNGYDAGKAAVLLAVGRIKPS